MTSPTLEQNQASDPAASVWVAASAGTGKTFVLTNRVLRLLLKEVPPEHILCLTFTKAAAAEMANRVNGRLGKWVACDRQLLCAELKSLTGHMPTEDEQDHARKLFARVLEVPGGLKIQTIHAFCQSLLGRFPLEAGIAPHFQVMDERTTLEHLSRARDGVLTEALPEINPALAHALSHISHKVTENTFADLIRELIGQRSGLERMMRRFGTVDRAVQAMENMLGLPAADDRDSILQAACMAENFDGAGLRQAVEALLTGSAPNQKVAAVMARWLSEPESRGADFQNYQNLFLTKDGGIRKHLMNKSVAEAHPAAFAAMTAEAERLCRLEEKLKLLTLRDNSRALLTMGAAMMAAFRDSKARHGVMDYDDLILNVTALIGRASIADWILYKLDGGIDHILIDEAQDTNPEQWQVVKTLANEFFVGEGQRQGPRTIFAVGDVKQSIYSFQRADPKEFVDGRHLFQKKATDAGHDFHNVSLALSFRSTAAVLSAVDRVFEPPLHRMAISFSEDIILHRPSRSGQAGLVEVWPVEKAAETPPDEDWAPPIIQQPAHTPEMALAKNIADRIAGWIRDQEMLPARGRPIRAGDIMILVRRRTKFDDYMIRALKARNIPVAGQDKMLLSDQIAVMDLVAVGNFVLLPEDDLTLAVVLKSPLVGFSEQQLYDLAYGRRGSLWSALRDRRAEFAEAHDFLMACLNYADTAPPFEFYSHLLTGLGGREKLLARLGAEANDPIDEFLQLAMGYEVNNISALQGFLSWLDRGDVNIKRDMEQGQDQVRIMTVHGAKGLQAPVVILPDTCQVPKKGAALLWAGDKEQAGPLLFWAGGKQFELGPLEAARAEINLIRDREYLRLLYVAMTRAEDRLYITGWEGKQARSETCWYDLIIAALAEMPDVVVGDEDKDGYLMRLTCVGDKMISEAITGDERTGAEKPLPEWARAAPMAEPAPSRPLSPSRPVEDEPAVISPLKAVSQRGKDHQRYHRGRLIHRLLEILPDMAAGEREQAARHFLSQKAHDLVPTDIDRIIRQITEILTAPDFAEVFSPHSRAEVSIVGLAGAHPVSGQVDRLVVRDHDILIIDYKTNRPPPKNAQDVPSLYLRQMAAYRAVLTDIYPDKAIRCLLLWTDVARLMELPPDMLDRIKF
ncbi:FIG061771: ATP-dependent nuclease subunit A [hydrothermal vent metagenome]|uniref:DNA 3'-5' helicase n=1 Tax=hydrothermal vent metagenome TaxID=652676 RepID=A0A3B0RXM5_9ZZZZ